MPISKLRNQQHLFAKHANHITAGYNHELLQDNHSYMLITELGYKRRDGSKHER